METTKTESSIGVTRRKTSQCVKFCPKEERNASLKKVSSILQKAEHERSVEEQQTLGQYSEVVADLKQRWQRREEAKRRLEEIEEPLDVLEEKCKALANAIAHSEHLVVYTGAGISTAARIPDYRGTNGIWTRLQQGKDIGNHDLSLAEPTFTHMALAQLYHSKRLKYVVSQNCDGLHLRSGLPRSALSELHGNMYIEVCKNCKPIREYWRLFDVTENTARYAHKTMRRCYVCNSELLDTIVHFGERGTLQWPLNWSGACKNADSADTILCLGSSLKVLKKYPWLWQMNKPAKRRPNLYIVNLQWTPKDDCALLKIHGKCDVVMKMVMKQLNLDVAGYERRNDPIFAHASYLCEPELHTTTQPCLRLDDLETKSEGSRKLDLRLGDSEIKIEGSKVELRLDDSEIKTEGTHIGEEDRAYDLTTTKCDKSEHNNHSSIKSTLNDSTLSKPKTSPSQALTTKYSSTFSIDNILKKSDKNVQEISAQQNFQTIMAYYKMFQNQMFSYLTSGLYPYQTSFFYPGIHNIINPIPFFNYDFDTSSSKNSLSQTIPDEKPNCKSCYKLFNTLSCAYYARSEPVFLKELNRFSKSTNMNKLLVCLCCDYTTDEESESDSENKTDLKSKKLKSDDNKTTDLEAVCDVDENICQENKKQNEKFEAKVVKIQAGWFGKGYGKYRKLKRKQYSNPR